MSTKQLTITGLLFICLLTPAVSTVFALETNRSSEAVIAAGSDWNYEDLSTSGYNVTHYETLATSNGSLLVIWSEYNFATNESQLCFCSFNGSAFSATKIIYHYQNNSLLAQSYLRISFSAALTSEDTLHIIYHASHDSVCHHIYYTDGIWQEISFSLESFSQYHLLTGSAGALNLIASVYDFSPTYNGKNIIHMTFTGGAWTTPELLTFYTTGSGIAEYALIKDVAISASDRIFVIYEYYRTESFEDDFEAFSSYHYCYKQGSSWTYGTYNREELLFMSIVAFDEAEQVHMIYSGGINESINCFTMNYTTYYKNRWSPVNRVTLFDYDNVTNDYWFSDFTDMKVVGSDILIPISSLQVSNTEFDIQLLHSRGGSSWTIMDVQLSDTFSSRYPVLSANKNGTVLLAYEAIKENETNLHVSYKTLVFEYLPTQVSSNIGFLATFLSLLACIPIITLLAKRKWRK